MPRDLSAKIDLFAEWLAIFIMIVIFSHYNNYLATAAVILWVAVALYILDRERARNKRFLAYCENIVGSGHELMRYAMINIPQAVMLINEDGRVEWFNELTKKYSEFKPEQGLHVNEFWNGILDEEILKSTDDLKENLLRGGQYIAKTQKISISEDGEKITTEHYFQVFYRQIQKTSESPKIIALFAQEITSFEKMKLEYQQSRTVLMYVQVDNFDEIMQNLNETEKAAMILSINEELEKWINDLSGFMQRVADDLFVVVLEQLALQKAIDAKFTILDKVRQIVSHNGIPVTLSIGVAVADKNPVEQSMSDLGKHAKERLNAALARGGDQVAINIDGKPQYFGGRTKAVEKHNRVRARVMANSIREHMEAADEIFVMGHVREDFDSFGAAMGVATMAMHIKKPVHVVLSNSLESIDKILDQFRKDKSDTYKNLFSKVDDLNLQSSINPLAIIVDTHIPYLVAAPSLLERIKNVIVIDHHRKNEVVIKNPVVFYHEPSSSSASELVTELLMYFDEKVKIGKLAATALYSGIVVDTKSFVVQTGVRTFDAASYLRRNGADPVIVRELFMSDYETAVALAKTKAQSEYYEGGLIVSTMPKNLPNIQAMAGQAADALLTIENVRMTIVLFQMKDDIVGISARSTSNLNVQVIMEQFGGGGHQTVAGAQVKNTNIIDLKDQVTAVARKYIADSDKDSE